MSYPPLENLGQRICIIGPSNSGKSTLAQSIAAKKSIPCLHLDQIAHQAQTNWERRPEKAFIKDHNRFISQDHWVVDGNYSICMKQRFDRADVVIWIDPPLMGCLFRYLIRSFQNLPDRPGKLEGAKKEFGWGLVKYTMFNYPKNKLKYRRLLEEYNNLPVIYIRSIKELNKIYGLWETQKSWRE